MGLRVLVEREWDGLSDQNPHRMGGQMRGGQWMGMKREKGTVSQGGNRLMQCYVGRINCVDSQEKKQSTS